MIYTPFEDYLKRLVSYLLAEPERTPAGYENRQAEMALANLSPGS